MDENYNNQYNNGQPQDFSNHYNQQSDYNNQYEQQNYNNGYPQQDYSQPHNDYNNQYSQPQQPIQDNYSNQYNQTQQQVQDNYSNQYQQYDGRPQQYNAPYYNQQYPSYEYLENENGSKGFAITSMILGICSLCLSCCVWFITFFTSIAGLVFGIVSLKKNESGRGMAIAGIILSGVALLFSIVTGIIVIATMAEAGSLYSSYYDYYDYFR